MWNTPAPILPAPGIVHTVQGCDPQLQFQPPTMPMPTAHIEMNRHMSSQDHYHSQPLHNRSSFHPCTGSVQPSPPPVPITSIPSPHMSEQPAPPPVPSETMIKQLREELRAELTEQVIKTVRDNRPAPPPTIPPPPPSTPQPVKTDLPPPTTPQSMLPSGVQSTTRPTSTSHRSSSVTANHAVSLCVLG